MSDSRATASSFMETAHFLMSALGMSRESHTLVLVATWMPAQTGTRNRVSKMWVCMCVSGTPQIPISSKSGDQVLGEAPKIRGQASKQQQSERPSKQQQSKEAAAEAESS